MENTRNAYKILVGKHEENLGGLGVDGTRAFITIQKYP
jgi:hypothetical protein